MQEVAGEGIPLGGGDAAILLQVADPRVAAGVARHSDFAERPLDRLHGTLTYLYVLAYGTEEEQHRVARRGGQAHRPGPGCAGCGLQRWVVASLSTWLARVGLMCRGAGVLYPRVVGSSPTGPTNLIRGNAAATIDGSIRASCRPCWCRGPTAGGSTTR